MSTVVLIPAYKPDEKLTELVGQLKENNYDVLIVNDGSGGEYEELFERLKDRATVIGYELNHGKGYALKYGMIRIKEFFPGAEFFITADADGQHTFTDIKRVEDKMKEGADIALTVRSLRKDAPIKSRIGNSISRVLFTIANARYLPDNQSGLRGFRTEHIKWMQYVKGDKYDFEMNVLLFAEKQGIKLERIPIEAIYFNNNESSHFRPLEDTVLIYKRFFETYSFSVIAMALGFVLAILNSVFFGYRFTYITIGLNWCIYALFTLVLERVILFRKIKYTPGKRRLVVSIFKFFIYYIICLAIRFTGIPFAAVYIFAVILTAVGEYFLLKVTYDN